MRAGAAAKVRKPRRSGPTISLPPRRRIRPGELADGRGVQDEANALAPQCSWKPGGSTTKRDAASSARSSATQWEGLGHVAATVPPRLSPHLFADEPAEPLRDLPFERMVISHGAPVHDRAAYERALELPAWRR